VPHLPDILYISIHQQQFELSLYTGQPTAAPAPPTLQRCAQETEVLGENQFSQLLQACLTNPGSQDCCNLVSKLTMFLQGIHEGRPAHQPQITGKCGGKGQLIHATFTASCL
jgi:hypothetical protein